MSEHNKRIKLLILPPPPPSSRDDTANRIKWVTGLYDHYIKVVHMQNLQNTEREKKNIKEVAPSVCGEKNNSWCKEPQDASRTSDKMGNDRKQLFTLLTAKETYSPCSRVWKPPDAALFSHFHIFVHATSESFSIFTEGGEKAQSHEMYIYILFFFFALWEDVEWILIMIIRKRKISSIWCEKPLKLPLPQKKLQCVWLLQRLCMINISLFWDWLGLCIDSKPGSGSPSMFCEGSSFPQTW